MDSSRGAINSGKETIDLKELVDGMLEDYRQLSAEHKVHFQAGTIKTISADRTRIEEVVYNLVSNAIKYSPKGGSVFLTTEEVEGGVKLSVADQGIGIPRDSLDQVFDRFFASDPTNLVSAG